MSIQGEINTSLFLLSEVVKNLDSSTKYYKATDVVRQYLGGYSSVGFISYARQTIVMLKAGSNKLPSGLEQPYKISRRG